MCDYRITIEKIVKGTDNGLAEVKPQKYVIHLPEDKHLIELLLYQHFGIENSMKSDVYDDIKDRYVNDLNNDGVNGNSIDSNESPDKPNTGVNEEYSLIKAEDNIEKNLKDNLKDENESERHNGIHNVINHALKTVKKTICSFIKIGFVGLLLYNTWNYQELRTYTKQRFNTLQLETISLSSKLNNFIDEYNNSGYQNLTYKIIDIHSKKWIKLPDMFHPDYPTVKPDNSYLFAIDEDNQKAYLYKKGWGLVAIALISSGLGKGQKNMVGDKATPNGFFKVVSIEKSGNWVFNKERAYGPYFLRLDTGSWTKKGYNKKGRSSIGLHGTSHPELLGSRASMGCIRFYNEFIDWFVKSIDKDSNIYVLIREKNVRELTGLKASKDLKSFGLNQKPEKQKNFKN